ncbi:MAG TPA: DUF4870 domain-containing protein [Vicinamibacterales bacterium]
MNSSIGLPSRTASALAYSGWWITGAILWFLERRDPIVRFHAAQAIVVFGVAALLVALLGALAAASLSFLPSLFGFFFGAAALTWMASVALWAITMWKIVNGDEWRIPVAAPWADRLNA